MYVRSEHVGRVARSLVGAWAHGTAIQSAVLTGVGVKGGGSTVVDVV